MTYDYTVLVTPTEAVDLSYHYRTTADIDTAIEIVEEFFNTQPHKRDSLSDPRWFNATLWATLWNAGRIQGIREERAKRKKK